VVGTPRDAHSPSRPIRARDGRYTELRAEWGAAAQVKLFWFYQFQALLAVLFALPLLVVASDPRRGLGAREATAVLVWLIGGHR